MTISRRTFLKGVSAAAGSLSLAGASACAGSPISRKKRLPNILFLMCDQQRHDALAASGKCPAPTPHFDDLAARGTLFERAYCQSPLCIPGRNSILLGRYAHSHGAVSNQHESSRELPSFPQVLRQNGYTTACIGKLHIQNRNDLDWDFLRWTENWKRPESRTGRPVLGVVLRGDAPLGQPAPFSDEEHPEWRVKESALGFLRDHRDGPWLLLCSFHKPHPPFQPPPRHWEKIDRRALAIPRYPPGDLDDVNPVHWEMMVSRKLDFATDDDVLDAMQCYYGNVAYCDELFGEILDALDRLGLRAHTLVVHTSDSGELLYAHRLWAKFTLFEEAVRVPLIVSFPEKLSVNQRSDALVEHVDLFPTFLEIAGIRQPETVQGRSLVPLLTGETTSHRDVVHCEYGTEIVMRADSRFKLIENGPSSGPELYDLAADPREIENLAAKPEHAERVETWRAELAEWKARDIVTTKIPRKHQPDEDS
jgi:choline-sulfatase